MTKDDNVSITYIMRDDRYDILMKMANCGKSIGNFFHSLLKPKGLTYKKWEVLNLLLRKGELYQETIAELVDIHKMTLAVMLDQLEEAGFIKREKKDVNLTHNYISLTIAGERKTKEILKVLEQKAGEIDVAGLFQIEEILDRLTEALRRQK